LRRRPTHTPTWAYVPYAAKRRYHARMIVQRRSRMRRTRRGKRLEFGARDLAIFTLLARYRYLRSTYIHAFVGGASETRFKERLGDLFHEGYIDRPAKQWDFANARNRPDVYEIDEGARRILSEAGIAVDDARTLLGLGAHRQFAHSLMICEMLASIELAVRGFPSLRAIWWPEILARAPESTRASATPFRLPLPDGGYIMPDGVFGLEYASGGKTTYRFFALEADRGTMPIARSNHAQTSYLGKLAAYRTIIAHQTHKIFWGVSRLLVLTVTTSGLRMQAIMEALNGEADDNAAFLFKAVRASGYAEPASHLLTESWRRAGHVALSITDAGV
jgi:hypothetical protein